MQHQIQIIPIPAFHDNYIWLIHNGSKAVVVDPGDATPVLDTLKSLQLQLETILITHHHHDHTDGVNELLAKLQNIRIFAPKLERFDFNHIPVGEPDTINCTDWLTNTQVIDLPGHTLGHIGFYIEHHDQTWLFCGDTLFGAGCGRLFEGTPLQMMTSLQKLAKLPASTQVYCTHEYTLQNINFALTLEPSNATLVQRYEDTFKLHNAHLPSLPSTIDLELASNPFLRCDSKEIQESIQLKNHTLLQVFTKIRDIRNSY